MRKCEEIQHEEGTMAEIKECLDGAGDYNECTLRNLNVFSCYKLWLVVEGGYNKVRSLPAFVLPIDYGKFIEAMYAIIVMLLCYLSCFIVTVILWGGDHTL